MAKSELRFGIIGAGTPNQSLGGKDLYHGVGEYHASAITEFAQLAVLPLGANPALESSLTNLG